MSEKKRDPGSHVISFDAVKYDRAWLTPPESAEESRAKHTKSFYDKDPILTRLWALLGEGHSIDSKDNSIEIGKNGSRVLTAAYRYKDGGQWVFSRLPAGIDFAALISGEGEKYRVVFLDGGEITPDMGEGSFSISPADPVPMDKEACDRRIAEKIAEKIEAKEREAH